jgi:3-phosphoinositide dependent protein kinase-1
VKAPSSLDPSGPTADDWIETLQQAKDIAVSMNISGSYASDNGFGEMSSSMSSPASTFGPETYGVSDRTHRNPLNRSQASLEDTTSKRKRFSKRQSKQGLGSAF